MRAKSDYTQDSHPFNSGAVLDRLVPTSNNKLPRWVLTPLLMATSIVTIILTTPLLMATSIVTNDSCIGGHFQSTKRMETAFGPPSKQLPA